MYLPYLKCFIDPIDILLRIFTSIRFINKRFFFFHFKSLKTTLQINLIIKILQINQFENPQILGKKTQVTIHPDLV